MATEYALPRGYGVPFDFTLAADGSLWYVTDVNALGRFSEETGAPGPRARLGSRRPGAPGATALPEPRARRATPARRATRARRARPGQQGRQGEQGPQGNTVLGSPGAAGPQGPAGVTGPRGATGAAGPAGPRGKTGAAAKIPKITCKLSGTKVTCKVGKRQRRHAAAAAAARATRAAARACACASAAPNRLYATGSRAAKSSRTSVRLHALRKVKAGKYTLAVDVGEDVTVHLTLRLG